MSRHTKPPQGELLPTADVVPIGEIEGRSRAVLGGAAHFDKIAPTGVLADPSVQGEGAQICASGTDVLADAIEQNRERENEDESGFAWVIDSQLEITTRALADGGVEIWQDGQYGADDAVTIHVAAHNAVQLARSILWAAGFKTVTIATGTAGGWSDVEDGDTPDNFPAPEPMPAPMTPDEIEALTKRVEAAVKLAEPKPEPEPEPDWSIGAEGVAIAHQPGIRVYTCAGGSVAMRQFDPDHATGEDPIITVTPANVPALISALKAEAARANA